MQNSNSSLRGLVRSLPGFPILQRIKRAVLTGEHWARVVMDRETREIVQSLSPETLSALEISGTDWNQVPFKSYESVQYPDFDICESALDARFDLIIAEQVFEHLLWPYRAAKNVYKMLNDGGHFLVTTPFLLRVHSAPTDCSRWTETGMKHLLAECGFSLEKIQTGSWGNRACVQANFSEWTLYKPAVHSLKNEPDFPVVIWALAQK